MDAATRNQLVANYLAGTALLARRTPEPRRGFRAGGTVLNSPVAWGRPPPAGAGALALGHRNALDYKGLFCKPE